jgi:hypothetical protein
LVPAGIPCLFGNLSVAAWIKFDNSLLSQLLTTIVLMLALVSMGYSRKWSAHILETERNELVSTFELGTQRLTYAHWPLNSLYICSFYMSAVLLLVVANRCLEVQGP